MGGRGSGSAGGYGGGGKTDTPRIKTDIGIKRNEIIEKLKSTFTERSFQIRIKDENGNYKNINVGVTNTKITHIANDYLKNPNLKTNKIGKLQNQFASSYYKTYSKISYTKKGNIDFFYYTKAKGEKIYFNIARYYSKGKGKIHYTYELYSITDKIRTE